MVIVDLKDHLDEIWMNMDRNTRRLIRKAQKEFEEVINEFQKKNKMEK